VIDLTKTPISDLVQALMTSDNASALEHQKRTAVVLELIRRASSYNPEPSTDPPVDLPVDLPVEPPVEPPVYPPTNSSGSGGGPANTTLPPPPPSYPREYLDVELDAVVHLAAYPDLTLTKAYYEARSRGVAAPVIGIRGDGGSVSFADGSKWSADLIGNNDEHVSITLVALDPDAKIRISHLGRKYGVIDQLRIIGLGIQGRASDVNFIIRQTGRVGQLILDGHRWIPAQDASGEDIVHVSAMSMDHGWDQLVLRDRRPGGLFKEHSLAYLKGGKATWILNNDLDGGNRTGTQIRPHIAYLNQPYTEPHNGPLVIMGNRSLGFGYEHSAPSGGSVLTVWQNWGDTWILNNSIEDARYGCVAVSEQSADRNHLNANGYPIGRVFFGGNTCLNLGGDREAVSISGCEEFHWLPGNDVAKLHFNPAWAQTVGAAIGVGTIFDYTSGFGGAQVVSSFTEMPAIVNLSAANA